jgi:3-oxoacyl-[acyl-carrier protein] reductase
MNVLITGGASGLGKAIVQHLAESRNKFNIFFTYASSETAAKELIEKYSNTNAIPCDYKNTNSVNDLIVKLEELNLDILIHNSYTEIIKEHFHKTDSSLYLQSFQQNILPLIQITQECLKHFRKKKSGKIITILTSYIINKPPTGLSMYVANKNYLHSLTKSWAVENVKFNISSNCISPSIMLTNLTADTDERIIEQIINEHPLKKLLTVQEVAQTVHFLCTTTNQLNGQNIVLNATENF